LEIAGKLTVQQFAELVPIPLDIDGAEMVAPEHNKNWDIVYAAGGITNTAANLIDGDVWAIDPQGTPVTAWRLRSK
jgi:hypothetical protein